MNNYFRAVTLGAFTWNNEERITLLLENIGKAGSLWLIVHFMMLTFCLNFPVVFQIARLTPSELYGRLLFTGQYEENREQVSDNNDQVFDLDSDISIEEFNLQMMNQNYGRNVLLPVLAFAFGLMIIIQVVFYLLTVLFIRLSRLNVESLVFRDRMGLALYSSTLPAIAAALLGLYLPTVHIIIYYFIVIFIVFKRSKSCPNG